MNKSRSGLRAASLLFATGLCAFITIALPAKAQLREGLLERIGEKQAVNDSGDPEKFIEAGGMRRSYIIHLPAGYDGKTALPLVVVFHGGGGNAPGARGCLQ